MKFLALMLAAVMSQGFAANAGAATICVNPNNDGCHATIQEGVDAAADGDLIKIAPAANTSGYNENVLIETPRLTLQGVGSAKGSAKREACPKTVIDGCATAANPTECGSSASEGAAGFDIRAEGVTIRKLTIRHFRSGVLLNTGSTGATISESCFVRNVNGVVSSSNSFDSSSVPVLNPTIQKNFFRGAVSYAVNLRADGALLDKNKIFTSEDGIRVNGNDALVSKNLFEVGKDDALYNEGKRHVIRQNTFRNWDQSIRYTGDQPQILMNKIDGGEAPLRVFCRDNDDPCTGGAISLNVITGNSDSFDSLYVVGDNMTVERNRISGVATNGIEYRGDNARIERNTVERSVALSKDGYGDYASIAILGSNNEILENRVSLGGSVGIGNFKGDNNIYRGNIVTTHAAAGIRIEVGDGNLLDGNQITGNHGEGIHNSLIATNTTITGNQLSGNRSDICNDGTLASLTSNTFSSGGENTACLVGKTFPDVVCDDPCRWAYYDDGEECGDIEIDYDQCLAACVEALSGSCVQEYWHFLECDDGYGFKCSGDDEIVLYNYDCQAEYDSWVQCEGNAD